MMSLYDVMAIMKAIKKIIDSKYCFQLISAKIQKISKVQLIEIDSKLS